MNGGGDVLCDHAETCDERGGPVIGRQRAVAGARGVDAVVSQVQSLKPRPYQRIIAPLTAALLLRLLAAYTCTQHQRLGITRKKLSSEVGSTALA